MLTEAIAILIMLLLAHALADFPWQGPYLSEFKSPLRGSPENPWWLLLGMHSFIHAGLVFLLTGGSLLCFALEFVSHYVIDWLRCHKRISYVTDQLLHIGMKVLYVVLMAFTAVP